MKFELIDTHAHLYDEQLKPEIDTIVKRALENGIGKIIIPNIDSSTIDEMLGLVKAYPGIVYPSIGMHPCYVEENFAKHLSEMKQQIVPSNAIAIGECGLDYYWNTDKIELQKQAFIEQIQWAKEFKLPLILHTREAFNDCIELIEKHQDGNLMGVFHCFSGNAEEAKRVAAINFHIGIGGVFTYKKAGLQAIAKELPLEKIILETDAPYLAPVPYRGKRNEPSFIFEIATDLAKHLGLPLNELAKITSENAKALFTKLA